MIEFNQFREEENYIKGHYMKLETVDCLTFFICCKLQAEALELVNFFLIKDLSINNEKNVSNIVYSLQFLSDIGVIDNPEFGLVRKYDSNPYDNSIIETASSPLELVQFDKTFIDYLHCGYYLKAKDKELLNKCINEYVTKFKDDDLGTSPDSYLIQSKKVESLIIKKYKTHESKRINLSLQLLENVDLLPALQALRLEGKTSILSYLNHRKHWHDDMGHDPNNAAIGMLVQASRQGKRYDLDSIEVEIEIASGWLTQIKNNLLLEKANIELKHDDGDIWVQIGESKYPISNPSALGEKYEIFKYIHFCKPDSEISLKNMPDEVANVMRVKNYKFGKLLTDLNFKGLIRKLFFYEVGDDSLKFRGFTLDKLKLKNINVPIDQLFEELEEAGKASQSVSAV